MLLQPHTSRFSKLALTELFSQSGRIARRLFRRRRQGDQEQVTVRRRWRANAVETLEVRALLSTFTVTSTANDGAGSLRQAIVDANANAGADEITFAIAGGGVQTINLNSALPTITGSVTIDATQSGVSTPVIEINCTDAGLSADGLAISQAGSGSVIKGLVINRFTRDGIYLFKNTGDTAGPSNVRIEGNYIGTDVTGNVDLGNAGCGIEVSQSSASTIVGNVISGNNSAGVLVSSAAGTAGGNIVQGNFIGTKADRSAALANYGAGIDLQGATGTIIGGMSIPATK